MKIPVRDSKGKRMWIVLKPSLIASYEKISKFIREEVNELRLAQKENGFEAMIKEAQKRGIVAYLEEER